MKQKLILNNSMPLEIRHIEILVSNLHRSVEFYTELFSLVGWEQVDATGFKYGDTKIYLKESVFTKRNSENEQRKMLGSRHMCFNASDLKMVEAVGKFLNKYGTKIIRGPLEVKDDWHPKGGYHTVDFYDPDVYILEVAYKETKQ